jgi:hypothetical protein
MALATTMPREAALSHHVVVAAPIVFVSTTGRPNLPQAFSKRAATGWIGGVL